MVGDSNDDMVAIEPQTLDTFKEGVQQESINNFKFHWEFLGGIIGIKEAMFNEILQKYCFQLSD